MVHLFALLIVVLLLYGLVSSGFSLRRFEQSSLAGGIVVRVITVCFLLGIGLAQLNILPPGGAAGQLFGIGHYLIGVFFLWFHEAGHYLFSFLGETMGVLGGTLTEFAVVLALMSYALWRSYLFSSLIALYLLGHQFVSLARYVSDARVQKLPLFGDAQIHDWHYMLGRWGLLDADTRLGQVIYLAGIVLMIVSFLLLIAMETEAELVPELENDGETEGEKAADSSEKMLKQAVTLDGPEIVVEDKVLGGLQLRALIGQMKRQRVMSTIASVAVMFLLVTYIPGVYLIIFLIILLVAYRAVKFLFEPGPGG